MRPCIFLDRDGVLNKDYVDYAYTLDRFEILPGVIESLQKFKNDGFLLIVITNQSGIAKGIYTHEDVDICHRYFQKESGGVIDAFYYSPYHPNISASLTRKPGSLMFEKAIAKFDVDIGHSWMLGDRDRDLEPARKLGIKTLHICEKDEGLSCNGVVKNIAEAYRFITTHHNK